MTNSSIYYFASAEEGDRSGPMGRMAFNFNGRYISRGRPRRMEQCICWGHDPPINYAISGKDVKGKAFLVKATGRALTAVKNRTLILDTLALIFNATQHSGKPCSVFFSRILTHKIR